MERRLAAILAADVVGYSRLVGEDEEGTLRTLSTCREVIDGLVASHHGRVFGSAGDSVIAEFASPVEAVRCAVNIQRDLETRNAGIPENKRMRFRIGVNLGDVVVDGDNLMGEGVNVAARLEGLAEPDTVNVSGSVHEQVKNKLDVGFDFLGPQELKNIAEPVPVFRVRLEPRSATSPLACFREVTRVAGAAGKALDRCAAVREPERGPRTGLFLGRNYRGHHHRAVQVPLALRHRAKLVVLVQRAVARG